MKKHVKYFLYLNKVQQLNILKKIRLQDNKLSWSLIFINQLILFYATNILF